MIAISSFRPRAKCPDSIWRHQLAAFASWSAFDQIIWLNEREPQLASSKTIFVPKHDKPSIKELAMFGAMNPGWSAIINADIVVAPLSARLEFALEDEDCVCGLSKRYDTKSGEISDAGMDFFCARQEVWRQVARAVPAELKLGKILWDSWMLSFFVKNFKSRSADFTPCKFIFHPQHGERVDQNIEAVKSPYLESHMWPTTVIRP